MAAKGKQDLLAGPLSFKPYKGKKSEEYMNEKQLAHFNDILSAWLGSLMNKVDETMHLMQEKDASISDPVDRASQEEEFSIELRTRDRERKLTIKIQEALDRIDSKEYGFCETCGSEIGIGRLEARPTAELCIDCKTFDEIREKQMSA